MHLAKVDGTEVGMLCRGGPGPGHGSRRSRAGTLAAPFARYQCGRASLKFSRLFSINQLSKSRQPPCLFRILRFGAIPGGHGACLSGELGHAIAIR